jgi:hypothetical protein
MADIVTQKNIGAMIDVVRASAAASAVAAGSGDATTTTGATIDRMGYGGSMPSSALFSVIYDATLASGKTLSIGYAVQHSPDNSSWADYQTATYAVVATGASGGSVAAGEFNVAVNLNNANRYVRINYNPDLNASGTDTNVTRAVAAIAGFDRLPASNA